MSSIPDETASARAISDAHKLASAGVPIFVARLLVDGDPDRSDKRWRAWQETQPGAASHAAADAWKPGLALCAVTGIACDVIDIDPRNGGALSLKRFNKELGEDGPETYWQVRTPSGGWHLYIAPLGIGGRNGFLPGMDLKSGSADGSGRGFVFLPPTVRPSKETGEIRPYAATEPWLAPPAGDRSGRPMLAWLDSLSLRSARPTGRAAVSELKGAVLNASAGGQREALLRYVHELERRGIEREDILDLLRVLCAKMESYNARDPWYPAKGRNADSHILGLLHSRGEVIGDADEDESEMLSDLGDGIRPVSMLGFQPLSKVKRKPIEWFWKGFGALGSLTVVDGEKGNAKSLIVMDVAARFTTGREMPDGSPCYAGDGAVILFGEEDSDDILSARAEAAGADMTKIFHRRPSELSKKTRRRKGEAVAGEEFALPAGAANIARVIAATGARFAVFDPINDFLDESIQTHNDASVRRALRPLAEELARLGVAGWAIRHMNKASGSDARMRGAGSTAFQNRARIHLAVGRMPEDYDGEGEHGLAVLDTNLTKRPSGVLAYTIVDSDILLDEDDNYAPMLEWHGWQEISANTMLGADSARKGRPAIISEGLDRDLREMFARRPVWPAAAAIQELKETYEQTTNKDTLAKARRRVGIEARPLRRRGAAGVRGWEWFLPGGDGNGGDKARLVSD